MLKVGFQMFPVQHCLTLKWDVANLEKQLQGGLGEDNLEHSKEFTMLLQLGQTHLNEIWLVPLPLVLFDSCVNQNEFLDRTLE